MNFCWATAGLLPRAATAAMATDAVSAAGRRRVVKRVNRLIFVLPYVVKSMTGIGRYGLERLAKRPLQAEDDLVDLGLRHDEGRREEHVVATPPVDGSAHWITHQSVVHRGPLERRMQL